MLFGNDLSSKNLVKIRKLSENQIVSQSSSAQGIFFHIGSLSLGPMRFILVSLKFEQVFSFTTKNSLVRMMVTKQKSCLQYAIIL